MHKNVGDFDRYVRITLGLSVLGWGIVKSSRLLIILGAMKVAEGITGWCPMFHILRMSTCETASETPAAPEARETAG